MKPRVTKKDVRLAAKVLSPAAAKVLAKHRTKSRGMQTYFREEKPIETVVKKVAMFPCFSSCDLVYNRVTLPRVKFLEDAE